MAKAGQWREPNEGKARSESPRHTTDRVICKDRFRELRALSQDRRDSASSKELIVRTSL